MIEYQRPHSLSTSISYDLRSQWEEDLSPRYGENHPHLPFPNHQVSKKNEHLSFSAPLSPTVQEKRPPMPLYRRPSHTQSENQTKRRIPTPQICPKFHSSPHPYLKANILAKILPSHANTSTQATSLNGIYFVCLGYFFDQ